MATNPDLEYLERHKQFRCEILVLEYDQSSNEQKSITNPNRRQIQISGSVWGRVVKGAKFPEKKK